MLRVGVLCSLLVGCGVADLEMLPSRTGPGGATTCRQIEAIGPVTRWQAYTEGVPSILADGSWVYSHDLAEGGIPFVRRLDLSTGEIRDFGQRRLIDARGRGVLWGVSYEINGRVLLNWDTVDGATMQLNDIDFQLPVNPFQLVAPATRATMPKIVAWLGDGDSVWTWRPSAGVAKISGSSRGNRWPDVEDGAAVWVSEEGAETALHANFSGNAFDIIPQFGPAFGPVVRRNEVLWLEGARLMVADATQKTPRVLHEGPCQPPASGSGKAVFACGVSGPDVLFGRELFIYDGQTVRQLPTNGGGIASPRTGFGLVAWIEYAPMECGSPATSAGRIWLLDLNDPAPTPLPVDQVGSPCWCCGALWRRAELSLASDAIAWNYALPSQGGSPDQTVGAAPIKKIERCRAPNDP